MRLEGEKVLVMLDFISRNSCSILPDMIKSKSTPSCIDVNNYIYIWEEEKVI
jgi:hypothetical protein